MVQKCLMPRKLSPLRNNVALALLLLLVSGEFTKI